MIRPQFFYDTLAQYGIDFYAGVPDSLLKNLCAYIQDHADDRHHTITANEGGAIGLAAGYHLATGKIPVVYMQNSGEGNAINPLVSLTDKDVYQIPVLLLIGWRGRPGVHDEPQHIKQGKITKTLLRAMGIKYAILKKDESQVAKQIKQATDYMLKTKEGYALIIEKDTFGDYSLQNDEEIEFTLSREEAIQIVADALGERDVIVSTTGMISRELFEYRTAMNQGHERDFLTVGSMGHASQIALGIAMAQPERTVWCFDGDGAAIMHMGSMAIVASKQLKNYIHVVFNNGAHDSVGGQPTVGLNIQFSEIAKNVNYKHYYCVTERDSLKQMVKNLRDMEGPSFIEVKVKKGNRKDLGRPTTTPIQNKESLMDFIKK